MGTSSKILTLYLGEQWNRPIITSYDLGVLVFRLYRDRHLGAEKVKGVQKSSPDRGDYLRLRASLLDVGVLSEHRNFGKMKVFRILGKHPDSASEILCAVDPFAVVSHLSAMEYHGLTDRMSKILFYSTPRPAPWKQHAQQAIRRDLDDECSDYLLSGLPGLTQLRFEKIDRTLVNRHFTVHEGGYKNIQGGVLRITSVGRTFLDMLRAPHLCGGMQHVVNVFKTHGEQYIKLILHEVDQHGNGIEKVRAGYLLEEIPGLTHETIESWLRFVQRGGSRKLDPRNDYDGTTISERWCLSINI